MELVAFVNPMGVILAALSHGSEAHAHDMSALLGTLRLEELPADAVSEIRQQIARQGWALVSLDVAKSLNLLGVLRPAGRPMT